MISDVNHRCTDLQGRRVLIVEDEYLIAWDLTEALTEVGAEVIGPMTTVHDALKALACEDAPDVALLDVSLDNHESALAIAEELQTRRIPFIFYTGYRFADVDSRFNDVTHCEKPMEGAALAAALGQAIQTATQPRSSVRRGSGWLAATARSTSP
jgi:DNA-binding NtrC family response regulator